MINWSYLAGFFDGEGSITHNGKGFRITIPQTNLEVIKKIQQFTKYGNVLSISKRKSHWKDSWIYYIARQKDILFFLKRIFPHLVVKKSYTKQVIKTLNIVVARQERHASAIKNRKINARGLRKRGLSYRAIGKRLNIDWGYARRIILNK